MQSILNSPFKINLEALITSYNNMILFNLDIDFNLIIEGSETTESLPFLKHIAKYFLETNLSISH